MRSWYQESLRPCCPAVLIALTLVVVGCSSPSALEDGSFASARRASRGRQGENAEQATTDRLLIKRASLDIEADDVAKTAQEATSIVDTAGGYVENTRTGDERASLTLRVPAAELEAIMDRLAALGKEKERRISSEDVTDTVIDLEATLKNKIALRDRLRALLERAKDVKEVLAVEEQLTRLQSDIDSMEGRLKSLKGKVQLATIDLSIQRKHILGPVSYLAKGVGWLIARLFVIR